MSDAHAAPLGPVVLRIEPGGRLARVAYGMALAGALVGATLIYLTAAALAGIWRTLALAVLTPVLVVSILALWRAAHAVSLLARRRALLHAELVERGVIGFLAWPDVGRWEERLQRALLLPAGATLRSIGPGDAETPAGQERMRDLYLLLGQARRQGATIAPPARATLVLLDDREPLVRMWDLSAYFERADAGDDAALVALAELEEEVRGRVPPAVSRALRAGGRR